MAHRSIWYRLRVRAADGSPADESAGRRPRRDFAVEAAAWRYVAEELSTTTDSEHRIALIAAAHRLLDAPDPDDQPAPLFGGRSTDRLPVTSRLVRIYGLLCSGKTVCARRMIEHEVESGRRVTVVRDRETGYRRDEYAFDDIRAADLRAVDSESLTTADARRAFAAQFDYRKGRPPETSPTRAQTIIVDAGRLPAENRQPEVDNDGLPDLIGHLAEAAADPENALRLVVIVSERDALSEVLRPFDTEIVFPGKPGLRDEVAVCEALQRLSSDEVVLARLTARVQGGGLATSRLEARIVDQFWWPNREHLSERMTRIVEKGQPTTAGFQHGVLRDPDGELTEFVLPDLQLATPSSVRTNA